MVLGKFKWRTITSPWVSLGRCPGKGWNPFLGLKNGQDWRGGEQNKGEGTVAGAAWASLSLYRNPKAESHELNTTSRD